MIKNINDESSLSFKIHFYLNLILTCILVYFLSNKIYCRLFNPLQDEINLSQQPIDIIIISIILVLVMIAVFFATKEQMKIDSEFKLGFEKNSQSNKFLSQILNKYKFNDKAEIEKFNYYQEHIEFVRFIASSFFILGLLGSFLGISETIKALSNNGDILNLENIKNALISIQVIFYVSISGPFFCTCY